MEIAFRPKMLRHPNERKEVEMERLGQAVVFVAFIGLAAVIITKATEVIMHLVVGIICVLAGAC